MPEDETCKICGGRGIVVKNGIAFRCHCVKQEIYFRRYSRANLAGILRQHKFENFDFKYYPHTFFHDANCTYHQAAQKAFKAAQHFCKLIESGKINIKGLLFCGPVGSGKTFLAACIANRLISKGKEVLFAVVPDLLDTIKATYDNKRDTEYEREIYILDGARNVPILILDDLGAHNYTQWTRNKIYSIINYRVNMELPTVITTNEEMETLETYLGERTTSRISQLCNIYMLQTPTDIRILKSKENMHNSNSTA